MAIGHVARSLGSSEQNPLASEPGSDLRALSLEPEGSHGQGLNHMAPMLAQAPHPVLGPFLPEEETPVNAAGLPCLDHICRAW